MSEIFHEVSVARSRRVRQCTWCAEKIEKGESYRAYRFKDCGDTGHVTLHPECYSAMQRAAEEEDGWIDWSVGDFNRGCSCQNGNCECNGKPTPKPHCECHERDGLYVC